MVRESEDGVAKCFKILVPFGIVLDLLLVNLSVDLHDQSGAVTVEIDDVRTDWMLPPEHEAIDLAQT
jgi:hypothetical protein